MTTVPSVLPGATITRGPSDWQILQQDASGHAAVSLAGRYRTEASEFRVELRAVRERDGAVPATACDWQVARLLPELGWEGELRLPAGGPYRIETRVWRANCPDIRPMRGDYVHHVGVGDLWVIAGQSNASGTGTGPVEDPPEIGVHQLGHDGVWKLAAHPLEDATHARFTATVHGVFLAHSPWLAFARLLRAELGHPIGLIPTAAGGSPVAEWQPGAKLAANMDALVQAAGGRVKGIVWHQGETEVFCRRADAYVPSFHAAVAGFRAVLGDPAAPIIVGQLGSWTADPDAEVERQWTLMREHQRQLAMAYGHHVVPTIDLQLGDEIHFTAQANVEMGRRYAATALSAAYGRGVPAPGIALRHAAFASAVRDRVRLDFDLGPAGWVAVGPVRDFTVTDAQGPLAVTAVTRDDRGWVELALDRSAGTNAMVHAHAGTRPLPSLRDRDQRPVTGFSVALD